MSSAFNRLVSLHPRGSIAACVAYYNSAVYTPILAHDDPPTSSILLRSRNLTIDRSWSPSSMALLQADDALFPVIIQRIDKVHVKPPLTAVLLLHASYALAKSSVWQGQLDCAALTERQMFAT